MPGRDAAVAIAAAVVFSFSIFVLGGGSPANGAQWLTNGSLDAGIEGWQLGSGALADGCDAGSAGLAFNDDGALLAQNASGPFPGGTYRFSGRARTLSGSVSLIATIQDLGNTSAKAQTGPLPLAGAYQSFSTQLIILANVSSLRVAITLASASDSVACLDDLSLEGPLEENPPTVVPTNTPTLTPSPAPTSTATTVPGATNTATAAASPTATATSPASTATAAKATATAAPSLAFINGGFEDGTAGWRKNGGELETVTSPRRSGASAGRFSSSSSVTSWLYQAVAIDPSQAYEFQGALRPDGNVGEAYLRISWYASGDGSGSLISSSDSTERVGDAASGFTWLTTGLQNPPAGAHSARLRVMLSPGGGDAVVFLDDLALGTGALQVATATSTAAPAPTQTALAAEATRDAVRSSAEASSTPPPGSTAQIAGKKATAITSATAAAIARSGAGTPRRGESAGDETGSSRSADLKALEDEGTPLWPYFALPGLGLLAVFAMLYGRSRRAT